MAVTLTGTTGNDTLFGSTAQAAEVGGLAGNDRVISQYTNSTLNGAAGNDTLEIQVGDGSTVVMNPGQGNDTIVISGLTNVGYLDVAASYGNNNSITSYNLGNDVFSFDTAGGSVNLNGTVYGGEGNDNITFGNGIDATNLTVWGNQGSDNLLISSIISAVFKGSRIGLGKGNDSATITATTGGMYSFTLNGGQGKDTLQMSLTEVTFSGDNVFSMGGGADIISATFAGTADNSGTVTLRGDSGTDTMTIALGGQLTGGSFSFLGDESQSATGDYADLITFDLTDTALDLTGTIAGGGGADTITLTSTLSGGSAGFYIDGGAGADIITIEGGIFAGTVDGGAGADSITIDLAGRSSFAVNSGNLFLTLAGGAGNDTFQNTSFGTAVTEINSSYATTALAVVLSDFTTGDIFKLLGMKVANENANVQRSAFYSSTFYDYTGAANGLTGDAYNNIALFQDGDDVILQILNGSGELSGVSARTGSSIGMAVICFKGNSVFGSNVARASGQLSSIDFSFTQGLDGTSFKFT